MAFGGQEYLVNRIIEVRRMMKVTRRRLAAHLGVVDRTLQRWEEGTVPITLEHLQEIARYLSVPVTRLLVQTPSSLEHDVAPVTDMPGVEGFNDILAATDSVAFRVLTPVVAAVDDRLSVGRTIFVSVSDARIAARKAGDVLLIEVEAAGAIQPVRLLRQFLPPALLVSNTPGSPHESTLKLDDRTMSVRMRGVVLLPRRGKDGLNLAQEPDLDPGKG